MKKSTVLYILPLLLGISYFWIPRMDPDLGWHLLGGDYILRTHQVPNIDFINSTQGRWQDYHWLAQIFLAGAYKIYGFIGIQILISFLTTIIFLVASRFIFDCSKKFSTDSSEDNKLIYSGLILLLLSLGLNDFIQMRPQVLSFLFLIITFWQLICKKSKYELLTVFILTTILVNCHVYWILLPFLWFMFSVIVNAVQ